MQHDVEELKQEMEKELKLYKTSPKSAKSYFISMKEISAWLKTKS